MLWAVFVEDRVVLQAVADRVVLQLVLVQGGLRVSVVQDVRRASAEAPSRDQARVSDPDRLRSVS